MKRPFGKFMLDTFFARKTMKLIPSLDLTGKSVVFTGGTDGLGREALKRFAKMGADICLLARNRAKAERLVEEFRESGFTGQYHIVECDLASLNQVRKAAAEVLETKSRIDYLINCAGINLSVRETTIDGFEKIFAVNYLALFLLTELLLPKIKETAGARIIQVSSATQEVAKLNLDDLQSVEDWSLYKSYSQSKLCVVMYARDLARRLNGSDVVVNSLNPGYIKTNLSRDTHGVEKLFVQLFGGLAAPAWVGGERIVSAALTDEYRNASGEYIYEDLLLQPNPIALDDEQCARLMGLSKDMVGM